MKVTTREQAWQEVSKLFPTDYEKDEAGSAKAGYAVYRHPTLNYYNRICDLGSRLEVLTGSTVTSIWIEEPKKLVEEAIEKRLENTIRGICNWIDKQLESDNSEQGETIAMTNALASLVGARASQSIDCFQPLDRQQ